MGKAEVIKIQVIAGNNDRNGVCGFIKVPFIEFNINKFIGNRFEKHIGGKMNTSFLHTQSRRNFELGGGKSSDCLGKRLFLQVGDVFGRECVVFSCKRAERANLLCGYDEIFLHKAVSFGEYRNDIFIKLYTKQYNHHTE